jgi:hypothetical protein
MRKTISIVLFLLPWYLFSQIKETRAIDSLKGIIRSESELKKLAHLNNRLARRYIDARDSLEKYAKRSLSI